MNVFRQQISANNWNHHRLIELVLTRIPQYSWRIEYKILIYNHLLGIIADAAHIANALINSVFYFYWLIWVLLWICARDCSVKPAAPRGTIRGEDLQRKARPWRPEALQLWGWFAHWNRCCAWNVHKQLCACWIKDKSDSNALPGLWF
jgi:hypothetical protein